jgi:2Fe-2S ferredoxin
VNRFLSTSSSQSPSPEEEAIQFLIKIGHDDKNIAQGVVKALKESGMSGTALLGMLKSLAGRWEVGEDAGLEALVEAVRLNQLKQDGRKEITLWVVPANAWKSSEEDAPDFSDIVESSEEQTQMMQRAFQVKAMTGMTLTDVAKFGDGDGADNLGESIECACAGIMACSTCHVVVDPEWFDLVGEPSESEQDMLDLAYAPRRTSRLGCQIELEEDMDGMVIRLPRGANNLMDFVPFE